MVEKSTPVVGIIISVFIAVLLGVVMLSISADQVNDITDKQGYVEAAQAITMFAPIEVNITKVYTVTEAPTGWKLRGDDACPLTNFVLSNASGTALTLTTDYVVNLTAGTYTMKNTTDTFSMDDNSTYATYSYCPDGYQSGFGGSALNLVPGFFALAILVSVAFLIFWILRKEGIDI